MCSDCFNVRAFVLGYETWNLIDAFLKKTAIKQSEYAIATNCVLCITYERSTMDADSTTTETEHYPILRGLFSAQDSSLDNKMDPENPKLKKFYRYPDGNFTDRYGGNYARIKLVSAHVINLAHYIDLSSV
jgi:hypothetical protein